VSTKSEKENPFYPCSKSDCFAYGHRTGCCQVLTDTDFGTRTCPFYKTKTQYENDRLRAAKRVSQLSGARKTDIY